MSKFVGGAIGAVGKLTGNLAKDIGLVPDAPAGPAQPESIIPPTKEDTAETRNQAILEAQARRGRASTVLTGGDLLGDAPVARKKLLGG